MSTIKSARPLGPATSPQPQLQILAARRRHQKIVHFPSQDSSGTYHMTAGGVASWCDFAQAIVDNASKTSPMPSCGSPQPRMARPLLARHIIPITTAEYPTPARRPAYSVLSNSLLTKTFGIHLPDWRTSLDRVFKAGNGADLADEPVTNNDGTSQHRHHRRRRGRLRHRSRTFQTLE